MLKIHRSLHEKTISLKLSGRMEIEDVAEVQRLLSMEAAGQEIGFDLQDITLIDREAVKFLARCEAENVRLTSCPAFIREWINAEGTWKRRGE